MSISTLQDINYLISNINSTANKRTSQVTEDTGVSTFSEILSEVCGNSTDVSGMFQSAFPIAEMLNAPLVLADAVLTEAERRSGCALVDIGADTTTVSVYSKNILRHLAVIPLGGANITKDIATLQIEEGDAEKISRLRARVLFERLPDGR